MIFDADSDTIAAIATPLGTGGVGIVRISGDQAGEILTRLLGAAGSQLEDRKLEYGLLRDGDEVVDEVLFVLMRGPRSFTGEDVAEVHGHGGVANMARILRLVVAAGARHAGPGEFTRRAFTNRRIDLTRAEAIADIVNASSEKALRVAQQQLRGDLGDRIDAMCVTATELCAEIEAWIDFPEDTLPEAIRDRQAATSRTMSESCVALADTFGVGNALNNGVDVVLRGPVNVGKSSLFNTLVGESRALVNAEAGTTRDYVEAQVVWDGVLVTIVDTAGIRETGSAVEGEGIEMGEKRAERADLELLIRVADDDSVAPEMTEKQILVISKSDLDSVSEARDTEPGIRTSSKSGHGIDLLKAEILKRATGGKAESAEGCIVTNERQRSRLAAAGQAMLRASELIAENAPSELVVVDLNSARQSLAEITGQAVGDEMLDALFMKFCIGK